MANSKRQNALLVEIMIAVLFFALSSTVILDAFATAYRQSTYAATRDAAMEDAQNIAESLYVSDDAEAFLVDAGFVEEGGLWKREAENFSVQVALSQTKTEAGELHSAVITVLSGEETIFEIPGARYIPEGVEQ